MFYKSNELYFKRAVELARNGEHRVRVGCLAVYKGNPVAGTWNTIRNTSPVDYGDISVHAEVACLNLISPRIMRSTVLYIARLSKSGEIMPSKPCFNCRDKIAASEIKAVYCMDEHGRFSLHRYYRKEH